MIISRKNEQDMEIEHDEGTVNNECETLAFVKGPE